MRRGDLAPGATTSISFYRVRAVELQYIDNRGGEQGLPSGTFGASFHRERAYSVFSDLPVEGGEEIVAALQRIHAAAGETLVREGGPADKFLILLDGEAEVVREGSAPIRLRAGDLFGELAILRDTPRRASVRVTSDADLLALDRDTFRDLVTQSLRLSRPLTLQMRIDGALPPGVTAKDAALGVLNSIGTALSISAQDFRAALGAFATGVTVVTTGGEEHAYGMTASVRRSRSIRR